MSAHIVQFLIVCPLVFLAGFIDAIAGGGGLISLPAYLITGLPVHNAIATNKMSSSMGTTIATLKYAKSGFIQWKRAVLCTVAAILGSTSGARLALLVDDFYFRIFLLIVLPLTAAYIFFGKPFIGEKTPLSEVKTVLLSMVIALCIGVYDGFYGPGTGTFYLLILTGIAHLNVHQASAMTKILNLTSNLVALINFLLNGTAYYGLGMAAAVFCIAGNYIGSGLVVSNGQKIVRPLILVVLVILFVKIVTGI